MSKNGRGQLEVIVSGSYNQVIVSGSCLALELCTIQYMQLAGADAIPCQDEDYPLTFLLFPGFFSQVTYTQTLGNEAISL